MYPVTRLTVLPVKGLRANHPAEVTVTSTGISGDRQLLLIDERDKLFSATRSGAFLGIRADYDRQRRRLALSGDVTLEAPVEPGAPVTADFSSSHRVPGRVVEGPWSELFSDLAGQPVRLVLADEPNGGRDTYPLSLLGEASVAELARRAGVDAVDGRRFRMSIEFAGAGLHAEDGWQGRQVTIGEVRALIRGPVPRCNSVNRHPEHGGTDLKALKVIRSYREGPSIPFGVHADVLTPGVVRVGDPVRLAG